MSSTTSGSVPAHVPTPTPVPAAITVAAAPARPANLLYGLDDRPPPAALLLLGLQHVAVMSLGLIVAVMMANAAHASFDEAGMLVRLCMLAMGIATCLQGVRRYGIGAGYLCPSISGPAYIAAGMAACAAGGVALLSGMLLLVGVFEICLSRVLTRLRALFPPHVIGVVVLMVGFEVVLVSVPRFMGQHAAGSAAQRCSLAVAVLALVGMVIPTVWGKGRIRLYSMLIGLGLGYAAAAVWGLFGAEARTALARMPWFALPRPGHFGWSLDAALIVPFLVATLSSTLKGIGDLSLCQKINDPNWRAPDFKPISGGVLALGIGNLLAGVSGGLGMSSSSSNVGLSLSLGATSRVVLFSLGGQLILLSFLPKVAGVFVLMPEPVMGACLVYATSYMLTAGFQILCAQPLRMHAVFVVGVALCFSLSFDLVPGLYAGMPGWLSPLFQNSLTLATLLAVVLNLILRPAAAEAIRPPA